MFKELKLWYWTSNQLLISKKPIYLLIGFFLCLSSFGYSQIFEGSGHPISDYNNEFRRDFFPISVKGLPEYSSDSFGLEQVCIRIQHTKTSDLKIELMSPDGNSIWLSNRNGGEYGQNYQGTCFSNTGFNGYVFEGISPFGGNYIPDGRLPIFNQGGKINGTWYLIISDLAQGHTGEVKNWSVRFGNKPASEINGKCNREFPKFCECRLEKDHCELLPDLIVSHKISANHIAWYGQEHQRYANQVRVAAALANVGYGPLEFVGTNEWYCDTTPVEGSIICGDGSFSRQKVNQVITLKNDSSLSTFTRPAGTIYYSNEPGHDHFHADNWVEFILYKKPWYSKKLRELARGNKISYCLFDSGNCTEENEFCQKEDSSYWGANTLVNYGLGDFNKCESDHQGISVGGLDYYGLDFEGQYIQLKKPLKKGKYFVEIIVDPGNKFKEINEENNHILVELIVP